MIEDEAQGWANTILQGLGTRFPWVSSHMSGGPDDCDVTPWTLHPAFHGCLDWHSSVHMQWSAVTLLTTAPDAIEPSTRDDLVRVLDERLTRENCRVEADYLRAHPGFERPYGWGWACLLTAAATESAHPRAAAWSETSAQVSDVVFDMLPTWMPRLTRPVRNGQHDNTAFGIALCLDAARSLERDDVARAIETHARRWYQADIDYPSRYEPGGNDFCSPALAEACLMQRVLPTDEFTSWLTSFLPGLAGGSDELLAVPEVLDATDGKLVHLYGLALHRAAVLRQLAPALDNDRAARALASADQQQVWASEQISHGDFMSTHWLVSFALQAELARRPLV
ncbi:DUF2891 family protein [Luteococcus sanguinis]|uniref:DUF2891 family protein n=1 Tax=Luteococcus sanguinis TaxID=174038 RepID=A0ABW1WWB1_9ACTN